MRTRIVLLVCSFAAASACGTSPVVDRDGGSDASTMDVSSPDVVVDAAMPDGASAPDASDGAIPVDDAGDGATPVDAGGDASADSGPCAAGQTLCGATCVDLATASDNCGMCGRACPGGGRCVMGVCQSTCGLAGLPCCVGSVCEEGTTCMAGTCARAPTSVRSGAALVSGGARVGSTNYRMFSTLGQSSQHQSNMISTSFRLTGGLVGVVGGL
jgi:hypothetical protein